MTRACPGRHTPAPGGYVAKIEWAERKARTHRQVRCPVCGLWAIWKRDESPPRRDITHGGTSDT